MWLVCVLCFGASTMNILDNNMWMIVCPANKGGGVIYAGGATRKDAWLNAVQFLDCAGYTKEALYKQGYRARKVCVSLVVK